jgi:SapC
MYSTFAELNLIEPVTLEVKVTPEQAYNLGGLHSISMEKLRGLDKEALFRLHQTGFLHAAFLVASSVGNVRKLIAMKQGKLRNQPLGINTGG